MSDAEWLDALFAQPERDLALLPPWARPVVTPHPPIVVNGDRGES